VCWDRDGDGGCACSGVGRVEILKFEHCKSTVKEKLGYLWK
jgi:hypothetical protein